MSIAVQTDMATPALARCHNIPSFLNMTLSPRFGSHELKKEFLEPSVLGDKVSIQQVKM